VTTIDVSGLVNARDLGGRARRNGESTPMGVFLRAENVDTVTEHGWTQLHGLGVRTVVDLRQPRERAADTGTRPTWLTTIPVDLDGLEHSDFWDRYWDNGLWGTALYFLPHLTELPHRMAAVLDAIASAPAGGVLFHCMSGRDRTGLVSLVLLAAASVVEDEIVDDYLETVRRADLRARASGRPDMEPALDALCCEHGTTTEGAFRAATAGFDFAAWSAAAGLSRRTVEAIVTWRGALAPITASGSSAPAAPRPTS
jgi:hypothetical protein